MNTASTQKSRPHPPILHWIARSISKEKIKPTTTKKPVPEKLSYPQCLGKWPSKDLPFFTCGCLILCLSTEVSDEVFRPLEQLVNSACTSGKWSHMANLFSSPAWKRQRVFVTTVLGPVLPAALKYTVLSVNWGDHKWKYCLEMLQPSFLACTLAMACTEWSLNVHVTESYKVIFQMKLQYIQVRHGLYMIYLD